MLRNMPILDYDEDDDRDDPLEEDLAAEDDSTEHVAPCPSCGEQVYDDAERCPYCGDWIIDRARPGGLRTLWLFAAVLALVAMLVIVVF
jgi:DNA-directed RNA polymerase subunit RPC12/RpoP